MARTLKDNEINAEKAAFRRFLYRTKSGKEESLWNSRFGIVPGDILESSTGDEAKLIAVSEAAYHYYVPDVGERIIVDLDEKSARCRATYTLDQLHCIDKKMLEHLQRQFPSREAAIDSALRSESLRLKNGGCRPHVITVNSGIRRRFFEQAVASGTVVVNEPSMLTDDELSQIDIMQITQKPNVSFTTDSPKKEEAPSQNAYPPKQSENSKAQKSASNSSLLLWDRELKPMTVEEWTERYTDLAFTYQMVAITDIDDCTCVSTVWIGHNIRLGTDPPHIFETAVLKKDGDTSVVDSYPTERDAFAGHARIVALLKKRRGEA